MVPTLASRPGLPNVKPPPVPDMLAPPPQLPESTWQQTNQPTGTGQEAPAPPNFEFFRPPANVLPRWYDHCCPLWAVLSTLTCGQTGIRLYEGCRGHRITPQAELLQQVHQLHPLELVDKQGLRKGWQVLRLLCCRSSFIGTRYLRRSIQIGMITDATNGSDKNFVRPHAFSSKHKLYSNLNTFWFSATECGIGTVAACGTVGDHRAWILEISTAFRPRNNAPFCL